MQYPLIALLLPTWAVGGFIRGGFHTPPSRSDAQREDASTIPIPRDRWFCVQLGISISPTNGWVELWIDDQTAARHTAVDTQVASGYDEIVVGLAWTADTNPPAQIWVDEVVVSEAPASCDL